jgi:hypothetical protein
MSVAPGQHWSRHQVIYKLINSDDLGGLERAANEIRIVEKDLRGDPANRAFRVAVNMEQARVVRGLTIEDWLLF